MFNIAIVTDSSCDLPKKYIKEKGIFVLPLIINMPDGSHYLDGEDISNEYIYKNMPEIIPTTSQPTPNIVMNLFEKIKSKGFSEAIIISISSEMSGTYQTINMCIKEEKKLKVYSFDSKKLSMALGMVVMDAVENREKGKSAKEILEILEENRNKSNGYFCIPTLKYLVKGGRIGKVFGTIGTLMHIVPVISINNEGIYYSEIRTISYKLALKKMLARFDEVIKEKTVDIAILHGAAIESAQNIFNKYSGTKGVRNIYLCELSPVLGVHTGPGLVGVVYRIL